ncbi:MAG: cyclic nucleotide-binding domain-containing protein [Candidatus Tectomicrobia bacterium]|nr:cyclic nucleotide-binding domain-containing protein [Candidatus Tectomicrobia bacterium]
MTSTIARRMREPYVLPRIMRVAEVCIILAAGIASASVLNPGPISLTLFFVFGQGLIVLGVVLYLIVTLINFKRRHGVSRLHFAAGETVFHQGDPGDFIYTIINGEVAVMREDPEQGETMLNKLGPGEYFGEMALVSDAPRNATVRTLTPVDVVTMERMDFTTLYTYLPDLRRSVEDVITTKLDAETRTLDNRDR